jgi:hypothetical protein
MTNKSRHRTPEEKGALALRLTAAEDRQSSYKQNSHAPFAGTGALRANRLASTARLQRRRGLIRNRCYAEIERAGQLARSGRKADGVPILRYCFDLGFCGSNDLLVPLLTGTPGHEGALRPLMGYAPFHKLIGPEGERLIERIANLESGEIHIRAV